MKELNYSLSRNIKRVVWDEGTLKVTFVVGRTYEFYGVPETLIYEMEKALSAGDFFNKNIKGKFEFKEVK